MAAFLRLIKWATSKGKSFVNWLWKNKGKVIEWLNVGQTFEWIYRQFRKLTGK